MMNIIRLNNADNVVVASSDIAIGTEIERENVSASTDVPSGHKVATTTIAKGDAVRKYDQIIGFATTDIQPGDHVHSHNLEFGEFERNYDLGASTEQTDMVPESDRATFQGYVRTDGSMGTRNYVGVLASVNCSNWSPWPGNAPPTV